MLDRVAERLGCGFKRPFLRRYLIGTCERGRLYLAKPLTYMNLSGEVLPDLVAKSRCSLAELLIVCDNLDLPVGTCRLKVGGSSAGHNGLSSIISSAGSQEFMRLYVGIGRPSKGGIIDYVLGVPGDEERSALNDTIERAADGVVALLDRPIEQVMNELNQRKANRTRED